MTSAAIEDKILSYGYSTTTGDITAVVAGNGLTGGASSGRAHARTGDRYQDMKEMGIEPK